MIHPVRTMPSKQMSSILMDSWSRPQAAILYPIGLMREPQKLMIDTACWLFREGKIDRLVVVHGTTNRYAWDEAWDRDAHEGMPQHMAVWPKIPPESEDESLLALFVKMEHLYEAAANIENFLFRGHGRAMLVVDSANELGGSMDAGSMSLQQISHHASYRRIMFGAFPRIPYRLWAPYKVLSGDLPHLLGYPSMLAMRARYVRKDEFIDQDHLLTRIKAAPTYFMEEGEGEPLRQHLGAKVDLGELIRQVPKKAVVFTHGNKEEIATKVKLAIWEQANDKPGTVLVMPDHVQPHIPCQTRLRFFTDPKVEFLVVDAHTNAGRLDAAHVSIHLGSCGPSVKCQVDCEKRVNWGERRRRVTHIKVADS